MCRWLAYSGPEIYLEDLIIKPARSLLVQSQIARERTWIHRQVSTEKWPPCSC